MAVLNTTVNKLNIYTLLKSDVITTITPLVGDVIALAYETDTGIVYEWSGGKWNIIKVGGAMPGFAAGIALIPYSNTTHDYICEGLPGTAAATAGWRIKRLEISTGIETWCDGNDFFDNVATDIGTVVALSYS